MVLRDTNGEVIFAAHRVLWNCNDALESEISAIMEGLALAHQWSELPVLIQTDCAEAITVMKCTGKNRSAYGHLIDEIKHLLNIRDNVLMKIERG
jgi:cell division GTPase FtsZ